MIRMIKSLLALLCMGMALTATAAGSATGSAGSAASAGGSAGGAVGGNPRVKFETSMGDIVLELYPAQAPKTVANFLAYVDAGFYDNTIFHRIIKGFVVQGGGFDGAMKEKTTRAPVENEAKNGLKNAAGTISMARTSDPHSATSQFFLNLRDNTSLDYPSFDNWGYAVFGKIVEGREVLAKMGEVPTGVSKGMQDVPQTAVVLKKAQRLNAKK
ncbi:peptidylprolyl isomerase [Niveibacterium sp. SC-1]|uniref:peptidylprolyl isomerase n=1 Tax=Niveibacterium sp. SC-1 TaxID=3135646 RepID=UPI0031204692